MALVPDLVTAFTVPPAARPNSADMLLTPTWNSLIEAELIEYTARVRPRASEKKAWLLSTPSTMLLLYRPEMPR